MSKEYKKRTNSVFWTTIWPSTSVTMYTYIGVKWKGVMAVVVIKGQENKGLLFFAASVRIPSGKNTFFHFFLFVEFLVFAT